MTDVNGASLTSRSVDSIAELSSVELVVGFGPAGDVRNSLISEGKLVPMRSVTSLDSFGIARPLPIPAVYGDSEAFSSLGITEPPVGAVTERTTSKQHQLAGFYRLTPPFSEMAGSLLRYDPVWSGPITSIVVVVTEARQVQPTTALVVDVIEDSPPGSVAIEDAGIINDLRSELEGEVSRFGREAVAGILASSTVLVSASVAAFLAGRRKDFGRRRALGATKADLITVTLAQTAGPSFVGSSVGALIGSVVTVVSTDSNLPPQFAVAAMVVVTLSALLASALPALVAARQDPVTAIRVP